VSVFNLEKITTERFFVKINKNGPMSEHRPDLGNCWIWNAATLKSGYGIFGGNGWQTTAHRYSYQIENGEIENKKMHVDHLCRVRNCVRPSHLELVTPTENYRRGQGWSGNNFRKTHCRKGHEFTKENTIKEKLGRKCKTCNLDRVKKRGKERYWEDVDKGRAISRMKNKKHRGVK